MYVRMISTIRELTFLALLAAYNVNAKLDTSPIVSPHTGDEACDYIKTDLTPRRWLCCQDLVGTVDSNNSCS